MKSIKKLSIVAERIELQETRIDVGVKMNEPSPAARAAMALIGAEEQEVFLVFLLDAKCNLIGFVEAARGGIDACMVDPRVVFRAAIIQGSCSIIVAHNHPSGDPTPSVADDEITLRLQEGAKLLGITLLDHVVVSRNRWVSYAENHWRGVYAVQKRVRASQELMNMFGLEVR
jgi:DNA repair protein RadC